MPLERSPLRRRSRKMDRYARDLEKATPALFERANHQCELAHLGDCYGWLHRHHRLMRSQGGTNDLDNLMLLCDDHHRRVHAEPAVSHAHGWLRKRGE